jgi:DNA-binding MarR family transcriptional regulator
MSSTHSAIKFFISLAKTQSILTNRFDRGLGGLGFNEFLILYYISQAEDQKISRIELAKKIGMTASGVTRLLLPMEKVHLVKSGPVEDDARIRFVLMTSAGKEIINRNALAPASTLKNVPTAVRVIFDSQTLDATTLTGVT